ncbi:hypothetical protein RBSH_04101 [Rhodopirellula baltica SH28]|uniref:Uncharacterized protein n=1 Tax=Rhodopirellula baltica SH28 TaxID=993517 RepID=K5DDY4_RHOBT|nr:hypothetical protein RBSH_04101 [Rhodopirellula baltica SH28]
MTNLPRATSGRASLFLHSNRRRNIRDRSKTIDSPINCVAAKTIHVETLCLPMTKLGMRGHLDATFCPDLKANPSASERTRQTYC